MSKLTIGVFGAAFDPPTLGHLDVLQQAAEHHGRILMVPSASHAFGKQPQPFDVRLDMLNLFAKEAGVACPVEVCGIESQLRASNQDRHVYTYDLLETLEHLYQKAPYNIQISFIRGPDNAHPEIWSQFYKAREIENRWPIFTAREQINVRSSQVREMLKSRKIIDNLDDLSETTEFCPFSDYLFPSVLSYIVDHGLYL